MFFLILILAAKIIDICYAHVFCQAMHSTSWTPLGYACPVNCASVIAAVKKINELDFDNVFTMQYNAEFLNISDSDEDDYRRNDIQRDISRSHPVHKIWRINSGTEQSRKDSGETSSPRISHFNEFYKMLHNLRALREVQALFKASSIRFNNKSCQVIKRIMRNKIYDGADDKLLENCVRRTEVEEEFVRKFTTILNKFTSSDKPFTEKLTSMILEKILGPSMDLRHGVFDAKRILKFLRRVLTEHKEFVKRRGTTIKLTSKFCMNLYVPGCFCIRGFVEHNGRCVKPANCFPDPKSFSDYTYRVTVH